MDLVPLGDVELRYLARETIDYDAGGQIYGTVEGDLRGDRLRGTLRLTNLAPRRADNVNLPTLRGILTTEDGAVIWVEFDGIATLRPGDQARAVVTALTFRTGDGRYRWLNTTFTVVEGVLEYATTGGTITGGVIRGYAHECRPTIGIEEPLKV